MLSKVEKKEPLASMLTQAACQSENCICCRVLGGGLGTHLPRVHYPDVALRGRESGQWHAGGGRAQSSLRRKKKELDRECNKGNWGTHP